MSKISIDGVYDVRCRHSSSVMLRMRMTWIWWVGGWLLDGSVRIKIDSTYV